MRDAISEQYDGPPGPISYVLEHVYCSLRSDPMLRVWVRNLDGQSVTLFGDVYHELSVKPCCQ